MPNLRDTGYEERRHRRPASRAAAAMMLLEDEPVPRKQRLVRIGLALITAAAAGYMLGRLILWPLLSAALT